MLRGDVVPGPCTAIGMLQGGMRPPLIETRVVVYVTSVRALLEMLNVKSKSQR